MAKKQLTAAQGIEAGCILFQLNSKASAILTLGRQAGLPSCFTEGQEQHRLLEEWRAFVHAVVTAGLMQQAPNSVLVGYLRETGHLLKAGASEDELCAALQATDTALTQEDFVDGPFAAYMALLGHGEQAGCPALLTHRLAAACNPSPDISPQVQARLAAVMALVISAIWDKLEEYDIASD